MRESDQQKTFEGWLHQHQGLLFKVVHAHAFTPHDRDDLFQEIATQVWHSIPRFRHESAVTTWLYRIALHCAIAWSRKEKRRHQLHGSAPGEAESIRANEGAVSAAPSQATGYSLLQPNRHQHARLDWLYEQIAQLDEIDRALTLLLLDGLSHREIAATLGLSETNVGVKIHRIKQQLAAKTREEINHGL